MLWDNEDKHFCLFNCNITIPGTFLNGFQVRSFKMTYILFRGHLVNDYMLPSNRDCIYRWNNKSVPPSITLENPRCWLKTEIVEGLWSTQTGALKLAKKSAFLCTKIAHLSYFSVKLLYILVILSSFATFFFFGRPNLPFGQPRRKTCSSEGRPLKIPTMNSNTLYTEDSKLIKLL